MSCLNSDFFEEVFKKEEESLVSIGYFNIFIDAYFGPQTGSLLYNHASLEQSFK